MIKKFLYVIIAAIILTAFSGMGTHSAHAEEQRSFFTKLEQKEQLVISIEWENEDDPPYVVFEAPDGTLYNPAEEREGTMVSSGFTTIYYCIEEAPAGDWYVIYDKKSNEKIYIDPVKNSSVFAITDLTVSDIDTDSCKVSFTIPYDEDRSFNYKIYLTASDSERGQEIGSAWARTNQPVEYTVDMKSHQTYDSYRVYVYAYFNTDGVDIFDAVYSEPFSYINKDQAEVHTPVSLGIMPDDLTVTINYEPEWNYHYLAAVFVKSVPEGGTEAVWDEEPYFFEESDNNSHKSFTFSYGDAEEIRVEFSEKYMSRGVYSTPKTWTIDLKQIPKVSFENIEATNKDSIEVDYEGFTAQTKGIVTVAGANGSDIDKEEPGTAAVSLKDSGSFLVEIPEDNSLVSLEFNYAEDIAVRYEKEIFRDITAPRIYMSEDYSDVTATEDTYIVSGTVTGAESLTIGAEQVTVDAGGSFVYEIKLSAGENVIPVVASDAAGNSARYTIKITKKDVASAETDNTGDKSSDSSDDSSKSLPDKIKDLLGPVADYIAGILAFVIALVIILIAVFTWKKGNETPAGTAAFRLLAVLTVISFISTAVVSVIYFVLKKRNNSFAFAEKAVSSVSDAYVLLEREKTLMHASIIGACIFGILAIATVTVGIIRHVKSKKA